MLVVHMVENSTVTFLDYSSAIIVIFSTAVDNTFNSPVESIHIFDLIEPGLHGHP